MEKQASLWLISVAMITVGLIATGYVLNEVFDITWHMLRLEWYVRGVMERGVGPNCPGMDPEWIGICWLEP